ncbi:hypothetical protein COO60DRAFT_1479454 [Scenedesmus sp. NREL 46B-D3]|nr:hypothetical protein COO60DRAFT_1479454 [Scenedesmus sp. NREL 46B-D3]
MRWCDLTQVCGVHILLGMHAVLSYHSGSGMGFHAGKHSLGAAVRVGISASAACTGGCVSLPHMHSKHSMMCMLRRLHTVAAGASVCILQ